MPILFFIVTIFSSAATATAAIVSTAFSPDLVCHDLLITPKITAFAWDAENRLEPIFNDSDIQIHSYIDQYKKTGHEVKSTIVPLSLSFDAEATVLGNHATWLPSMVSSILKNHGRFVTTKESGSPFSLWMTVPPGGRHGRTGVLLYEGRPIIATDPLTNFEYFVELKGAGLPMGGYENSPRFKALRGGLWEHHANLEYLRLRDAEKLHRGHGVLGLGYQTFSGEHGKQELLFRLTPGNLRLSFEGSGELSRGAKESKSQVEEIGRLVGELLARGYGATTHMENFIVDRTSERLFLTDYLDVLPLWDWSQIKTAGESELEFIDRFIRVVELSSAWNSLTGNKRFYGALAKVLVPQGYPRGVFTKLQRGHEREPAKLLLEAGLAMRILDERRNREIDPLLEPSLEKTLARSCGAPTPQKINFELVHSVGGAIDSPFAGVRIRRRADRALKAYQLKKLDLNQLLDNEDVLKTLNFARHLRLRPLATKAVKWQLPLLLTGHFVNKDDYADILTQAWPGLRELKLHIEREHVLVMAALVSNPDSEILRQSRSALYKLIEFYRKTSLPEFRKMICEDREAFKRLFYLPHHYGFKN